ncbi:MAG: hypothetical protein WAV41_01120 [Microgenomates group bacterium]
MHFICRSFLGQAQPNSWSQYWENEPEDQALAANRGHLFALLNLVVDQNIPTSDIGHRLINELNQQYFSSSLDPIPVSLTQAIQTVVNQPAYNLLDISLTIAIIHQSQLYLAMYNSGYVFLVRQHQFSQLLSGTTSKVNLVSGLIAPDDIIFICTQNFYDNATLNGIKSYLSLGKTEDIEESIMADIYTFTEQATLASLLIGIHPDVDTPSPLPDSPEPSSPPVSEVISPPDVYISHLDSTAIKNRRYFNIIIAIILILALSVSVFFGNQRNQKNNLQTKYQTLKSAYQAKMSSALATKNINLEEAQKIAAEAKSIALELQSLKINSAESSQLLADALNILSQTGSADSYSPQDYYDTTDLNSAANYSHLISAKNFLYLLDQTSGRLDRLDLAAKSKQKIIQNDQLKNATDIAENNGQLYLLIDKKIYQVSGTSLNSVIDIPTDIPDFTSGKIHFWNSSLYLLGTNIWKFTPSGTSFSQAQVWLKDGNNLPPTSSSLAINGQVWVLAKSGDLSSYTRGTRDATPPHIATNLSAADHLVVSLDSEIISFVDGSSVVYIYHKSTASASKYNFGNRQILSTALDSTNNRLLVLCADKKIYQIKL